MPSPRDIQTGTASTQPQPTICGFLAAAVVTDTGGAGSHAAIVARECRIPAVMGTVRATRTLSDGQYVRVDGTNGHVTVVPSPA